MYRFLFIKGLKVIQKNPWDKIVDNIALKEGEYPGTKDVTRFRQSLQNKKIDASKGITADLDKL